MSNFVYDSNNVILFSLHGKLIGFCRQCKFHSLLLPLMTHKYGELIYFCNSHVNIFVTT